MLSTAKKTLPALERKMVKYQDKLARAKNPSQAAYARQMIAMTKAAIAKTTEGVPVKEPDGDDVVELERDQWTSR